MCTSNGLKLDFTPLMIYCISLTDDPEVKAEAYRRHDASVRGAPHGFEVHQDLRRPVGGGVRVHVLQALREALLSSFHGHHLDHLRHQVRYFLHLKVEIFYEIIKKLTVTYIVCTRCYFHSGN